MTTETITETTTKFRSDPASAKGTPTVRATLVEGRASLSAGAFSWEADLPTVIGGTNVAPSPDGLSARRARRVWRGVPARHVGATVRGAHRRDHCNGAMLDGPSRARRHGWRLTGAHGYRARDRGLVARSGIEDSRDVRGVARALPDLPRPPEATGHLSDDPARVTFASQRVNRPPSYTEHRSSQRRSDRPSRAPRDPVAEVGHFPGCSLHRRPELHRRPGLNRRRETRVD